MKRSIVVIAPLCPDDPLWKVAITWARSIGSIRCAMHTEKVYLFTSGTCSTDIPRQSGVVELHYTEECGIKKIVEHLRSKFEAGHSALVINLAGTELGVSIEAKLPEFLCFFDIMNIRSHGIPPLDTLPRFGTVQMTSYMKVWYLRILLLLRGKVRTTRKVRRLPLGVNTQTGAGASHWSGSMSDETGDTSVAGL